MQEDEETVRWGAREFVSSRAQCVEAMGYGLFYAKNGVRAPIIGKFPGLK